MFVPFDFQFYFLGYTYLVFFYGEYDGHILFSLLKVFDLKIKVKVVIFIEHLIGNHIYLLRMILNNDDAYFATRFVTTPN